MTFFRACLRNRYYCTYVASNNPQDTMIAFKNAMGISTGSIFKVVLENNGIHLTQGEAIHHFKDEVFWVLLNNEYWEKPKDCLLKDFKPVYDYIFEIYNPSRTKKMLLSISNTVNVYREILQKALEELQVEGTRIVFEKDGTLICGDNKDAILMKSINHAMMILGKDDAWAPARKN